MNLYTSDQLEEMIMIARTWALNKPSGPLPPIPKPKYVYVDNLLRKRADKKFEYPAYKDPHWIIKFLL